MVRTVFFFWMLLIFVTYTVFEIGVRLYLPNFIEVTEELDRALVEINKKHNTISNYIAEEKKLRDNRSHLDPVLGWNRQIRRYSSCLGGCEKPFKILLIGDSVSAGHGVKIGIEDYGYLLSSIPNRHGIEVYNAAVGGYSVDQMLEKAKQVSKSIGPDLILFSYIAHDLLRSGRNYIYLKTRPGLALKEGKLTVTPPGDLEKYIQNYVGYKESYRQGLWMLSFLWQNRRYYVPYLHRDFFLATFNHVVSGMALLARELGSELSFVMLPQDFDFRNRDDVVALMDDTLRQLNDNLPNSFKIVDIEECVRKHLAAKQLEFKVMRFHPGPSGHQAYADCLAEQVVMPALGRKLY